MSQEQDLTGTGRDPERSLRNVGMGIGPTSADILTDLISTKAEKFRTAVEPTGNWSLDARPNIF